MEKEIVFWFPLISKNESEGDWADRDISKRMEGKEGIHRKTRALTCHNGSRKRGENGQRSETSTRTVVLMGEERLINKGVGTTERTRC